jgi:multidrug transporter EmrE-like cation transporter
MEYIVPVVSIEALADYNLAMYVKQKTTGNLVTGVIGYNALLPFYIRAIEEKGLTWANSAWDGYSNLATSVVGIVVMGEKPSNEQMLGIILISAGLFLLGTDKISS